MSPSAHFFDRTQAQSFNPVGNLSLFASESSSCGEAHIDRNTLIYLCGTVPYGIVLLFDLVFSFSFSLFLKYTLEVRGSALNTSLLHLTFFELRNG